jgi:hypothetical protein
MLGFYHHRVCRNRQQRLEPHQSRAIDHRSLSAAQAAADRPVEHPLWNFQAPYRTVARIKSAAVDR